MQTVIKTLSIKLDEPLHERLKQLAKLKERSPHWLMKEAITAYIEREEALERLRQETMAGWKEYQTTGEYVIDEAMTAWLESWGTDSEGEPQPYAETDLYVTRPAGLDPTAFVYR